MPGIIRRNDDDIADLTPGNPKGTYKSKTMDYFWDYDHLNFTLATYCPQMRIHPSMNELWNVPSVLSSIGIGLKELRVPLVKTSVIKDMTLFKKRIAEYVQEKSPLRERRMPVRFHMAATYFAWPTEADSPVLRRNWGRILRSRRDARELAASALFGLQTRFRLRLDPRRGLGAAEEPSTHAKADTFVGVHLRTEVDAAKYPPYEEQAAYYLHHLQRSGAAVAFLATGASREHVATFRQRARDLNVTVVCKQDLLGGDELGMLERHLSYDQRALVDYEIMLRAGLVVGTSQSSFAWNLAMRRANLYEHVGNSNSTPAAGRSKVQWQDGYTTLFGQSEAGEALQRTIWP